MRSRFAHARPFLTLGTLLLTACPGGDDRLVDPKPVPSGLGTRYIVLLNARLDSLALGESRSYSARVTDVAGVVQRVTVEWTSTNPAILIVSAGTATAVSFGTAGVVARFGTAADTATICVSDAGVSLQLSPSAVAATLRDTLEFQARLVSPGGTAMAMQGAHRTVSDSSAATILGDGRVATHLIVSESWRRRRSPLR